MFCQKLYVYVYVGKRSFKSKLFLLVKAIFFFFGNHQPEVDIYSVKTVPFNGRHFLYWKLFLLLEAIHFSGNHSFQWKPFPIVEAIPFRESFCFSWKSLPIVETFSFSRSHFFLEEAAPFNRNFSFFWKPVFLVFQHFHQQQLSPVMWIIKGTLMQI